MSPAASRKTRAHFTEPKTTFEGGSTRSAKLERYDLIPPELDEALAQRFGLGALKHGDRNWLGGGAEFIVSCVNHGRAHIVSLLKNGPDHADDDLAAILWNFGVLTWFRQHKPAEYRAALGFAPTAEPIPTSRGAGRRKPHGSRRAPGSRRK